MKSYGFVDRRVSLIENIILKYVFHLRVKTEDRDLTQFRLHQ